MNPMSHERLEEIRSYIRRLHPSPGMMYSSLTELLAEADYWREAVRTAQVEGNGYTNNEDMDIAVCPFCRVDSYDDPEHKPDCPWVLAQDAG
jgi:hypothetical protein